MLRLLCVTAHPDDEAGCFGGILAKYSEAGVECSVICLTGGERAANRGDASDDEALKAARRKEFADSCHHLGVARCEVLQYADGGLDREDFNEVTGRLVYLFRTLRPHVSSALAPRASSPPIPTTAWRDCSLRPPFSGPRARTATPANWIRA